MIEAEIHNYPGNGVYECNTGPTESSSNASTNYLNLEDRNDTQKQKT